MHCPSVGCAGHKMKKDRLYHQYKIWHCDWCGCALDRGLKRFIQRIRNRGY